ncbi:energy transducer TonB [Mucilaginibacter ximonensis]|uniref:Energy transducer TonB n=1 Tax=Mucilaginibacter ximonensis TaxID=538021 RepID=A0ABW5YEC8_9SPHI
MYKTLSLLLLWVLMLQNVHAQTTVKSDTLKYYFDAANIETNKETADHSLLILPKSEKDGGLYPVIEYYKNSQLKLSAFLTSQLFSNNFEGPATTYYPNGNKQRVATYHNGLVVGESSYFFESGSLYKKIAITKNKKGEEETHTTEYFPNGHISMTIDINTAQAKGKIISFFPNGNIYTIKEFPYPSDGGYIECRDSIGTVLATKGNGKVVIYTNDFTAAIKKASLKGGTVTGDWEPIIDSAAVSHFDKSEPIESIITEKPSFNGGSSGFIQKTKQDFIDYFQNTFRYPKEDLKKKTTGDVNIVMIVEKDGAITHIKVNSTVSKAMENEVVRVLELSTPWSAGLSIEGKPVRSATNLTIKFNFLINNREKASPNIDIYFDDSVPDFAALDAAYNKTDSAISVSKVDRAPEFMSGVAGIKNFLFNNQRYPVEDRENKRSGKVYVQFIIEKDGHVSNVHALTGASVTMKAEAERVPRLFPNWQPGTLDGKPVRVIYTLPIAFLLSDTAMQKPDVMPQFPGGLEKFGQFLVNNVHFPAADRENGVSGKVFLTFMVETDGSLSNIKAIRAPSKTMADEGIRVLSISPAWTPGYANGKPVRVQYTVPINFTLEIDNGSYYYNSGGRGSNGMTFRHGLNN